MAHRNLNGNDQNSSNPHILAPSMVNTLTSPVRDIYTRGLYRVCLKFTTSEDEDEGKHEPSTAFWTFFGHETSIGNTPEIDDICRKMDDSMSGPQSGLLSVLPFLMPGNKASLTPALLSLTQKHAHDAGLCCGWHVYGDRGDAAVRVGRAKLSNNSREASNQLKTFSFDMGRWELCKGASFAAGNSVFFVEDVNMESRKLTLGCTKGPLKGKYVNIAAARCPYVFGRAHEADLCIMDRELSRRHGAIVYVNNSSSNYNSLRTSRPCFVLVDLESTNGSYMRLIGPYGARGMGALSIGDEFIVGRTGFCVNRFDYGISESIGVRPTMEDRTIVVQSLLQMVDFHEIGDKREYVDLAMTSFCGVFDGHGGDECSSYLAEVLPRNLAQHMLTEKAALRRAVEASSHQMNAQGGVANKGSSHMGEDSASEIMRRILKTAYLKTDREFITPKNAPQSGSTAATVVLLGRRLFAANVGDSRVVLCRAGGQCVELTSDHKPTRPDEAARVRAAGGFILHKRVMGELAITRAFGDKSFKLGIKAMLEEDDGDFGSSSDTSDEGGTSKDLNAPLVSAEPEISSTILSHSDEFLLLACDGLFDVFRSQDAIALARQELISHRGEPGEVARILSDQAIRVRRSRDNVSILIMVLRPFWKES